MLSFLCLAFAAASHLEDYEQTLQSTIALQLQNPQQTVTQLLASFKQSHLAEQAVDDENFQEVQQECSETFDEYTQSLESVRGDLNLALNDINEFQRSVSTHVEARDHEHELVNTINQQLAELNQFKDHDIEEPVQNVLKQFATSNRLLEEIDKVSQNYMTNKAELLDNAQQKFQTYVEKLEEDLDMHQALLTELELAVDIWTAKLTDAETANQEALQTQANIEKLIEEKQNICEEAKQRYEAETQRRQSEIEVIDKLIAQNSNI